MKTMDNIRYMYIRSDKDINSGAICVAYRLPRDSDTAEVSLTFCSPSSKFKKVKARNILNDRFSKGEAFELKVDAPSDKRKSNPEIYWGIRKVLDMAINAKHIPNTPRNVAGLFRLPSWLTSNKVSTLFA